MKEGKRVYTYDIDGTRCYPHTSIGGGYHCDKCRQIHGGSSVHCPPTIDELLTAQGQNEKEG